MRILLVTHETSRTGAPRVAVMVARGLVSQGHDVRVVARFPGPLMADFRAVAPTRVEFLHRVRRRLRAFRVLRMVSFLLDSAVVLAIVLRHRPDLVYVNSAAAAIYLRPALWLRRRVVLHVHESAKIIQQFLERARCCNQLRMVDVIACSPSVQLDLATLTGREPGSVPMIPSVPDDALVTRLSNEEPDIDYPSGELVVGCCGAVEYRKGADLWEEIATRVSRTLPGRAIRFVWIGQDDVAVRPGETKHAEFLGPRANPYPHVRNFDVFALPSRDDPFPLVVIEAMLLGKPVVAFDVGGVSQQLGDAGELVSPGDVADFADHLVYLLSDAHERRVLGNRARSRAVSRYSTEAFLAELADVVTAKSAPEGTPSGSPSTGDGGRRAGSGDEGPVALSAERRGDE